MADKLGQQLLNGIDINKLIKGFADEAFVFKNFLTVTPASNREIRWWSKAGGVLDSTKTTGITGSKIQNAFGTLPPIIEESATRRTSYVKHFSAETPWFTYADIKDSDPDMFGENLKQVTRAIQNQIDHRIFDVLSGSSMLSGSAAGSWGDATNGNPILDLLSGSTQIELKSYNTSNIVVLMNPKQKLDLLNYVIDTAGSNIPGFSSQKVKDGVLMSIVGQRIVVSNNVTNGLVLQIIPQQTATWKTFSPLTSVIKEEPGIGTKIRIWEDGEIILTDPNSLFLTTGAA